MNKHFITITITTDTNVSRDDMIDYFTALMFDGDVEMLFNPKGIVIDASRTSTEFGNGVCVYGKAD
jgi:hypothetical protein